MNIPIVANPDCSGGFINNNWQHIIDEMSATKLIFHFKHVANDDIRFKNHVT